MSVELRRRIRSAIRGLRRRLRRRRLPARPGLPDRQLRRSLRGITCDSGQVCENGACVAPCGCRDLPEREDLLEATAPASTPAATRSPATPPTVCVQGACQDGCQGVSLPDRRRSAPTASARIPDGGIVIPAARRRRADDGNRRQHRNGRANQTPAARPARPGAPPPARAAPARAAPSMAHEGGITTCSCDTSSGPGAGGLALLLAALGVASLRRACARPLHVAAARRARSHEPVSQPVEPAGSRADRRSVRGQ